MKPLTLLAAAVLLASFAPAHAGSNTCQGTVQVGKEWTTVKHKEWTTPDGYCRVKTDSKLGRQIIAACPDESECLISIPLNKPSRTLTVIDRADRL